MYYAEILSDMVVAYEYAYKFNSKIDGNKDADKYRYVVDTDFRYYSNEDARLIDSLTLPFDVRVKDNAYGTALDMQESRRTSGCYTFKGHDKQYYEKFRRDANDKISQAQDKLEKAMLIEKYGKELDDASKFFELVEIVRMLKQNNVWNYEGTD